MKERDHGRLLATWLTRRGIVFLHVPNEGVRSLVAGAELRRQGLQKGFPDYLILSASKACPRGCAIELKSEKGHVSKEQRAWLEKLDNLGIVTHIARGWESAVKFLEDWGY